MSVDRNLWEDCEFVEFKFEIKFISNLSIVVMGFELKTGLFWKVLRGGSHGHTQSITILNVYPGNLLFEVHTHIKSQFGRMGCFGTINPATTPNNSLTNLIYQLHA